MNKIFLKMSDGNHYLCTKTDETGGCLRQTLISKEAYNHLIKFSNVKDIDVYKQELSKQTSDLKQMRDKATLNVPNRERSKTKKKDRKTGVVNKSNAHEYMEKYNEAVRNGKKYFHFEGVKKETDKEKPIVNHMRKIKWIN